MRVGLSLRDVGYGSTLAAVGTVAPQAHANRVIYAHPGVSEWYANGPLGLEQGFTLAKAPAGKAKGPLTLSMGLSSNATPSLTKGEQSITLDRAGGTALHYTGLSVTDAGGHALHSWMQLAGGRLLLRIDAHNARYPLRIDPFIQQGEKLVPAHGENQQIGSGQSVALSSDGNTALIGGYGPGAAWVFTRSGSAWIQQGEELSGSGVVNATDTSTSVALSSDGNTALIGARGDNAEAGAAWVFTRSGSTWTQQGSKLTASEGGAGEFGYSVALSSDGDSALIGARTANGHEGLAWMFTRSNSTWSETVRFAGAEEIGESYFGSSVALSSDGNTVLIGGPVDNNFAGAAWGFTRAGFGWTYDGKLTGTGSIVGDFGTSVALSSDGSTALVGGTDDGDAWAFVRSQSTWTQQGPRLTGSEVTEPDVGGTSAALSADGNTAVLGSLGDNSNAGAAWEFTRSGSIWTQQGVKITASGATLGALFGDGVALSAGGETALIGAPGDNFGVGSSWVYTSAPAVVAKAPSELKVETTPPPVRANPPPPIERATVIPGRIVGQFRVGLTAVKTTHGASELRVREIVVLGTAKGERVSVSCHQCRGASALGPAVAKGSRTVFKPRNVVMRRSSTLAVDVTDTGLDGRFKVYGRFRVTYPKPSHPQLSWTFHEQGCLAVGGTKHTACPT